jgi:hypothetical protein
MPDSLWSLRFDLASTTLLIWFLSVGCDDVELRRETHLYFYDRYSRLAKVYSTRGNESKARALRAKAIAHYHASGDDGGPPYAAAQALPRPRLRPIMDARSTRELHRPDNVP